MPTKIILHLRTCGYYKKYLEVFSIEEVLREPIVIFEGLHREHFHDGFCYCAIPKLRYVGEDGSTAPAHLGVLFAVYVNKELAIFEFGWERMVGDKYGYPENYPSRFTKIVFPKTEQPSADDDIRSIPETDRR